MKYARIINDMALDVVTGVPGDYFVPELAAQFVPVPDQVDVGWVLLQNVSGTALADGLSWHPPRTWIEQYLPGAYRYAQRPSAAPTIYSPAPGPRWITELAFRNRFTFSEKVAIELAATDNPVALAAAPNANAVTAIRQQTATVRTYLADAKAATYIDLDRADTRAGVQALESVGLLAPGRAAVILDSPVQEHERFRQ